MNSENLERYKLRSLVLYAVNYQCFNSCLQFKDVFLFTISLVLTNVMSSLLYNYYCHFVDETKVQIRELVRGWILVVCFIFFLIYSLILTHHASLPQRRKRLDLYVRMRKQGNVINIENNSSKFEPTYHILEKYGPVSSQIWNKKYSPLSLGTRMGVLTMCQDMFQQW